MLGPLGTQDLHELNEKHGIVRGHFKLAEREYVGVTQAGAAALQELTRTLRADDASLRRAVDARALFRFLLDHVLARRNRSAGP